ncbi:large putative protein with C-terminal endonuclease I domain [Lachnospiraceae bacterium KM106-2]|nr:large putative protein with C-terminal endonuclease I domain [Lachnospiraceae bacterium KM106-2]
MRNRFKQVVSMFLAVLLVITMLPASSNTVSAADSDSTTGETEKETTKAKTRVSVHDPSIVKAGGTYYVYGSHIEAAKSTDLMNWTSFTNGYATSGNAVYGDLDTNLSKAFKWAGSHDSDCKDGYAVWAPYVFYNEDYINEDKSKGAYMIYFCTSSTYKRSCIAYAVSDKVDGPFNFVDTVVYSGFTKDTQYDTNSEIDTKYTNTNLSDLIKKGTVDGVNEKWFNSDGNYNTSYAPNAIDPALFSDTDGKLYMVYGSWSGGIYELEMDPTTGQAIYPGTDKAETGKNRVDRYFGTQIAGGYGQSGEGPFVIYSEDTGYYYLYMTYGGLQANGGYNMRVFRSKTPDGPYLDAAGSKATFSSASDLNYNHGVKVMGNYQFSNMKDGYKSCGHNSALIDDDKSMYLFYHARFNDRGEEHELRVHQMFMNKDGWPVVAPYEYNGDKISESGYDKDQVVGSYEFINHGIDNGSAMLDTKFIQLKADGTIDGDLTGTWTKEDKSYNMTVTIDGVTYDGVFFKQNDESDTDNKVMTFTAIGTNNQTVWGSQVTLTDEESVDLAVSKLQSKIPSQAIEDITLPQSASYGTELSWSSNKEEVLSKEGKVNRKTTDTNVVLTATVTKGEVTKTSDFTVKVKALSSGPMYQYTFEGEDGNNLKSTGKESASASLVGNAKIVKDDTRGSVLEVTSDVTDVAKNYLKLPEDLFVNNTEGYSVGMWVNIDKDSEKYFEHSALFEASNNVAYPVTRISGNLISRINCNDSYSDVTQFTKQLKSNTWQYLVYTVSPNGIKTYLDGELIGEDLKDLSGCFKNHVIDKMTDVRVGSGNIWNDRDVAYGKFDNVAFYSEVLSGKEIQSVYEDTKDVKENEQPTTSPAPTATVSPAPTATVSPAPTATVSPTPTATVSPAPTAAPTAMSKVTGLKAVKNTEKTVTLKWNPVKDAKGYAVYGFDSAKKSYKKLATVNKTTYKVTKINKTLKAGTTYRFKVVTLSAQGSKYNSKAVTVTTCTKPSKVKLQSAVRKSAKTAKITWKKVAGTTKYEIYVSTNKKSGYKKVGTTNKTSYTCKKLKKGHTYYVKVRAYKKCSATKLFGRFSSQKKINK